MKECCAVTADYTARQGRMLRVVLAINVAMFLIAALRSGHRPAATTSRQTTSVTLLRMVVQRLQI